MDDIRRKSQRLKRGINVVFVISNINAAVFTIFFSTNGQDILEATFLLNVIKTVL
jgi:hypothetical protein